jgi:serine O-acetyltransferase
MIIGPRSRQETTMAQTQMKPVPADPVAGTVDPLWNRLTAEAEAALGEEPALAGVMLGSVLQQPNLESAVIHRVAGRLAHSALPADIIEQVFLEAVAQDPAVGAAFRADINAVLDRDPASSRVIEPVLYFKGFHAIQAYRLAHWLWHRNRQDLALYLQSRSSEVFQTDIHPAARIGRGIFLDHATGLVVGSTAVIEDNVSMLQNVTLGGTGKERGDRHPKIRHGVLIGAGAKILGNIEVGHCARIAAGSVVLKPVPSNATVAGVPAKVIGSAGCAEPARSMDHFLSEMEGI